MIPLNHTRCFQGRIPKLAFRSNGLIKLSQPVSISTGYDSSNSALHFSAPAPSTNLAFSENDEKLSNSLLGFKTTTELLRALLVFKISNVHWIVSNSNQLFTLANKPGISSLSRPILKETFYKHFCSGENENEMKGVSDNLKAMNIKNMLYVPLEATIENDKATFSGEIALDKNAESLEKYIDLTAELDNGRFVQGKLTAVIDMNTLLEMNETLKNYQTNHTEPLGWDFEKMSQLFKNGNIEGIKIDGLSEEANNKLQAGIRRLDNFAQKCVDQDLLLMLDAEQTYIQASLGYLILLMQSKYNQQQPMVYNTYQCYRKDTLDRIKADEVLAEKCGFKIAAKCVRGAYLSEERALAEKLSLADPLNESYEATSNMYNNSVLHMLSLAERNKAGLVIATHNEASISVAVERIRLTNMDCSESNVAFAQVLGFADHTTKQLGDLGYTVYKSVPYGKVEDTLLYLARRAQENQTAVVRIGTELKIVSNELKSRMLNKIGIQHGKTTHSIQQEHVQSN